MIRLRLHFLLAAVLYTAAAHAGPGATPCRPAPERAQLTFGTEFGQRRSFDGKPEVEASIERRRLIIMPAREEDADNVRVGYGHEYSIIDVDDSQQPATVSPSSNGHLHVLYVPIDLSALINDDWQLRLQPTLSVSSNLLKDPNEIDSDALQLNGVLIKEYSDSEDAQWAAGVCADHRFGDYRLYPIVSWLWEGDRWTARLGYPDNSIQVRRGSLTIGARVFPRGNRWRIHDAEIGDSFYRYEAWQAEWYVDWRFAPAWGAELSMGELFDSRHRFELETGETFRGRTDSPFQVGLSVTWFRGGQSAGGPDK